MGLSASKTTRTSRILLYIVLGWTLLTAILWLLDFVLRYGMSTASWDEVSQSVCCLNAGTTPLGTGVFVSDKFPGAIPERRIFLLTARHVAEASHKLCPSNSVTLVPTQKGNSQLQMQSCTIHGGARLWMFPTSRVDLAILDMSGTWDSLLSKGLKVKYIDFSDPDLGYLQPAAVKGVFPLVSKDFDQKNITLGTEVNYFGLSRELWYSQYGRGNLPIALRSATIATPPQPIDPLHPESGHLIGFEGNAKPGCSGGPVFAKVRHEGRERLAFIGICTSVLMSFPDAVEQVRNPNKHAPPRLGETNLGYATPLDLFFSLRDAARADILRQREQAGDPYIPPPSPFNQMVNVATLVFFFANFAMGVLLCICRFILHLRICRQMRFEKTFFELAFTVGCLAAMAYATIFRVRDLIDNGLPTNYNWYHPIIFGLMFLLITILTIANLEEVLGRHFFKDDLA